MFFFIRINALHSLNLFIYDGYPMNIGSYIILYSVHMRDTLGQFLFMNVMHLFYFITH